MNILLTSVGRRAYMVKYFKEALGETGEVHVCNSDDKTVAFHYADHAVMSPLIYDENYIPFLLEYCEKEHIELLISLFDIDLLMLARNKEKFKNIGTNVIVSNPDFIAICNDKWKTYSFLRENGFHTPRTFLTTDEVKQAISDGLLSYPLFVKPRFGCGSISIGRADDEAELDFLFRKTEKSVRNSYLKYESAVTEKIVLIQECLEGQEYGADLINDLLGNSVSVILRKKIAMRSGETDIAEIISNKEIETELKRLAKLTNHIANLDTDVFLVDGIPYILEMNARFGGGYPFSHMAGCNLPAAIVSWCKGESVSEDQLTSQVGIIGCKEIFMTNLN